MTLKYAIIKKVSKLYCLFNRNPPSVGIWEHSIPAKITKTRGRITVNQIDGIREQCMTEMVLTSASVNVKNNCTMYNNVKNVRMSNAKIKGPLLYSK